MITGALVQEGVLSVYSLMLLNQCETTHSFKVLRECAFLLMGCISNEIPRKQEYVELH